MKNGFTLVELLVVIVLIALLSGLSFVLFETTDNNTVSEDLRNKYKSMQSSAITFVDLNEAWLDAFTTSNEIYVKLGELQASNYFSEEITNPITGEKFPSTYFIKIYKVQNIDATSYINTCVISRNGENTACIANSEGFPCECCDLEISNNYNPSC